MTHDEIMSLDHEYIMQTYGRYPVVISHGKNATLTDLDGTEYIDFASGIGVHSLGAADSEWIAAVTEQLNKTAHISNYYYSPITSKLAELLVTKSGLSRVFFGNSGAEANEGSIKTARKYSFDKYGKGRSTIVSVNQSFHGRTITTLAATGQADFHQYFYPFTEGFKFVPLNDAEALNAALTDDVCAVLIEPIQGEGGVNIMCDEYAQTLRKITDEKDILLIFDEVQCGAGRTGTLFAYEHYGFTPDIVTMAKGIGGGLPIGLFICGKKCDSTLGAGQHGTTFGSNPVVAAGAYNVLSRISKIEFLSGIVGKGEYIKSKIKQFDNPLIKDVRGRGLMIGIQIADNPKIYSKLGVSKGLLLLTAGTDVIRLLPPLTITFDEIDKGLDILKEVLTQQ
jgi:acetylornithine/N-succinyldiaminopimelate aminotransferase